MDREVYREHWVNDRVFAYTDIQLKELAAGYRPAGH